MTLAIRSHPFVRSCTVVPGPLLIGYPRLLGTWKIPKISWLVARGYFANISCRRSSLAWSRLSNLVQIITTVFERSDMCDMPLRISFSSCSPWSFLFSVSDSKHWLTSFIFRVFSNCCTSSLLYTEFNSKVTSLHQAFHPRKQRLWTLFGELLCNNIALGKQVFLYRSFYILNQKNDNLFMQVCANVSHCLNVATEELKIDSGLHFLYSFIKPSHFAKIVKFLEIKLW